MNLTPPYFQVYDERFTAILGPNPTIRVIVENDTFAFAHDGPIWVEETDEVFFSGGRTEGRPVIIFELFNGTLRLNSGQVSVINLNDLKTSPTGLINFTIVREITLPAFVAHFCSSHSATTCRSIMEEHCSVATCYSSLPDPAPFLRVWSE